MKPACLALAAFLPFVRVASAQIPGTLPDEKEELLQEGHRRNRAGKLDEAIALYQKALQVDPDFSAAKSSLESALETKMLGEFKKTLPKDCRSGGAPFETLKACAKSQFVVGGEPVSAAIVRELVTWLSDTGDQVISIHLPDAQGSNRFFTKKSAVVKHGKFFEVTADTAGEEEPSKCSGCYFSYAVEGVTDNGIFVVSTSENSGGMGHFRSLLFLRIEDD